MKILEELKDAQEVLYGKQSYIWGDNFIEARFDSGGEAICDVLRRIPQLIEVVEMIDEVSNESLVGLRYDHYEFRVGIKEFARELLSKLEGDK